MAQKKVVIGLKNYINRNGWFWSKDERILIGRRDGKNVINESSIIQKTAKQH